MRHVRAYLRLLGRRRWSVLLVLVIGAILAEPLLGSATPVRLLAALLFVLILGGAVYTGRHTRQSARAMAVLLLLWLATELARLLIPNFVPGAVTLIVTLLVLAAAIWATFAELLGTSDTSPDALMGTMFGYFLIAVAWSYLYAAIAVSDPEAFALGGGANVGVQLRYFSLVTMTTLGYGDIVPLSPAARIVSALQAVCGTLYVAIMIGRVVSSFVGMPQRPGPRKRRRRAGSEPAAGQRPGPRARRHRSGED